jgi:hypothetical protein
MIQPLVELYGDAKGLAARQRFVIDLVSVFPFDFALCVADEGASSAIFRG